MEVTSLWYSVAGSPVLPNLGGNREYDPKGLAGMAVPQWRDGLRALMSNLVG